jgi:hypothetical protein
VIASEKGALPGGFLKAFFKRQAKKEAITASADTAAGRLSDSVNGNRETALEESQVERIILRYFPNPTTDVLHVRMNGGVSVVLLTDIGGKLLQEVRLEGKEELTLDLSAYASGNYFLRCEHKGKWLTGKVVVVK